MAKICVSGADKDHLTDLYSLFDEAENICAKQFCEQSSILCSSTMCRKCPIGAARRLSELLKEVIQITMNEEAEADYFNKSIPERENRFAIYDEKFAEGG